MVLIQAGFHNHSLCQSGLKIYDIFSVVFIFLISKLCLHGLLAFSQIKMANFAEIGAKEAQSCSEVSNDALLPSNSCYSHQIENDSLNDSFFLYFYLVVGISFIAFFVSDAFYKLIIISTRNIHDIALAGLFKSPMRFFNTNPPGRLLNRFSQGMISKWGLIKRWYDCFRSREDRWIFPISMWRINDNLLGSGRDVTDRDMGELDKFWIHFVKHSLNTLFIKHQWMNLFDQCNYYRSSCGYLFLSSPILFTHSSRT